MLVIGTPVGGFTTDGSAVVFNGTIRAGDTFTRASTATYLNSSSVLTSAAINEARFDYSGAGSLLGLLIEPQRTNLYTYSADLSNAAWVSPYSTETAVTGGYKITPVVGAGVQPYFYQNTAIVSGTTYTDYVVVKADGYNFIQGLTSTGFASGDFVNFNLATGAIGNSTTGTAIQGASITNLGGGFYLCAMQVLANATTTGRTIWEVLATDINSRLPAYTTDGTSGVIVAYTQREIGSFLTSYIPTTAATVTRAADALTLTLPYATSDVTFTFDDNTTQTVTGVASPYAVPTTLNRRHIKTIKAEAA